MAKEHDRAFHFHCGGGDPDIDLVHAKPEYLFSLLVDVQDQPVVLVHSGYPWIRESAYIASVLPRVYLELSELIPWGFGQVEWALEMLVGTVPAVWAAPAAAGRLDSCRCHARRRTCSRMARIASASSSAR